MENTFNMCKFNLHKGSAIAFYVLVCSQLVPPGPHICPGICSCTRGFWAFAFAKNGVQSLKELRASAVSNGWLALVVNSDGGACLAAADCAFHSPVWSGLIFPERGWNYRPASEYFQSKQTGYWPPSLMCYPFYSNCLSHHKSAPLKLY